MVLVFERRPPESGQTTKQKRGMNPGANFRAAPLPLPQEQGLGRVGHIPIQEQKQRHVGVGVGVGVTDQDFLNPCPALGTPLHTA